MLENKDYCDYETCVDLKELGYDGKRSNYCYIEKNKQQLESEAGIFLKVFRGEKYTYVNAIHLYEAQKWLREEKHIDVLVYLDDLKGYFTSIRIWESSWKTFVNLEERDMGKVTYFANYEEALSEGIKEAVKILKEK